MVSESWILTDRPVTAEISSAILSWLTPIATRCRSLRSHKRFVYLWISLSVRLCLGLKTDQLSHRALPPQDNRLRDDSLLLARRRKPTPCFSPLSGHSRRVPSLLRAWRKTLNLAELLRHRPCALGDLGPESSPVSGIPDELQQSLPVPEG